METSNSIRLKKQLVGIVVGDKMEKTVTVQIDRRMAHPMYDKVINISKTYKAHDESNERKVGDVVRISQSRPLSKTKRWVVVETVSKSKQAEKPVKLEAKAAIKTTTKAKVKTKSKSAMKRTPK